VTSHDGSPDDSDARLRWVYVGEPCPACDGDEDCPTCESEGEVGDWIPLAAFRAMAAVAAGDRPPLLV
jgi:hypothetical protein